jgi:hypothetical protein
MFILCVYNDVLSSRSPSRSPNFHRPQVLASPTSRIHRARACSQTSRVDGNRLNNLGASGLQSLLYRLTSRSWTASQTVTLSDGGLMMEHGAVAVIIHEGEGSSGGTTE